MKIKTYGDYTILYSTVHTIRSIYISSKGFLSSVMCYVMFTLKKFLFMFLRSGSGSQLNSFGSATLPLDDQCTNKEKDHIYKEG